jgi:ribosomal protein S18 acetylase RimI-like enzyme
MIEKVQVRVAERDDVREVAASLATAFYDDPVCTFAYPSDTTRQHRLEVFFATQARALWNQREIHITDDSSSAAIWAPPGEWKMSMLGLLRGIVPGTLRTRPKLAALRGYLGTDRLHPDEPHWYLEALGTMPAQQSKGLGAHVLAPVLRQCDEEGVPVWTWSSNESNLAFYYRQGFEVLDKLEFAPGGPPIFPIRRDPRPLEL